MTKTVLITGSSSGIGEATVIAFAKAGWKVAATSRRPQKAQFQAYPNVNIYKLDVVKIDEVKRVFRQVMKDFGHIDAVVNNAGYGLKGVFEAIKPAQIQAQFDTNVFGLMNVTREAIGVMRPRRSGVIIQVASMGGRLTFPLYSMYHASKWAVEGFSESLHFELRSFNIGVKIIEPGVINTKFYSSSRHFVRADAFLGYDEFTKKVDKVSQDAGSNGVAPEKVAQTILRATLDKNTNKLRYTVGRPAPQLLWLRKILPERLFLRLIRLGYRV